MTMGRRRQQRRNAVDLVAVAFGDKNTDLRNFVRTGEIVQWRYHTPPATPGLIEAKKKLLAENEATLARLAKQEEAIVDDEA